VLIEEIVFEDATDNITSCDEITNLPLGGRSELPGLNLVEAGHIDSSGDED